MKNLVWSVILTSAFCSPAFAAQHGRVPAVVCSYSIGFLSVDSAMKSALEDLNRKLAVYRDVEITAPAVSISSSEIVICVTLNNATED